MAEAVPTSAEARREFFEERVFNARFMASIKRVNPSGPMTFMSVDCPMMAELVRRDASGEYVDEQVSAMWFGFCMACQP